MADATKIIDLSWLPGAETIANVIQLDLTAMDGGQTLDLVINGQAFTVRYDSEPALGDNGLPVPGDVIGHYWVEADRNFVCSQHVSPHGTSRYGDPHAKGWAAREVALAIGRHVMRHARQEELTP